MFWKRKTTVAPQPLVEETQVSEGASNTIDNFEDWVKRQDHNVIHDLLVRSAMRLLPGLFAENVEVLDPVKFDGAVFACYPIVLRGLNVRYHPRDWDRPMSGNEFYDSYPGAADGGVSYTAFHCVESVTDAFGTAFNKRYLCEVNNNLSFALPDDHQSFFSSIKKDGKSLVDSSQSTRDEIMVRPLWDAGEPSAFFATGLAQFRKHAASTVAGKELLQLVPDY